MSPVSSPRDALAVITKAEAARRVENGASFLDGVRPGWYQRINIETLALIDPCACIVGQLSGGNSVSYGRHAAALCGVPLERHLDLATVTAALGFDFDWQQGGTPADLPLLQDAWVAAIATRRFAVSDDAAEKVRS